MIGPKRDGRQVGTKYKPMHNHSPEIEPIVDWMLDNNHTKSNSTFWTNIISFLVIEFHFSWPGEVIIG